MPKNEKRGGSRAPKNFEPNSSYSRAKKPKPGSRSPGHRGYKPESESDAPQKKTRWSSETRVARGHSADRRESDRPQRFERLDRFDREREHNRGERRFDRANPERRDRDERAPRSFDDRPARGFDRDDRGSRRFGRDDRAPRRSDDRPARSFDRDDRPARSFDRDDRAPRRFDRDDRPARSFDRSDRPARDFDRTDRPARRFDGDQRPARRFENNERFDRGERRFERSNRFERDRTDRPRHFDRDDRSPRRFEQSDRPRRDSRTSDFYGDAQKKASFTPQDDVVLERLTAQATQAGDVEGTTFADLGLGQGIVRALGDMGAESPFPIQAATIPDVLAGRDVLGRGRTGSGKTIAFGAPVVEGLLRSGSAEIQSGKRSKRQFGRAPRALILAPTRELALQIDRTVQPIARSVGLFTTQIYGGVPQRSQVVALERGVDIVIGTPGRILDLLEQGRLDLSEVRVTVLDEADHMCDLGFLEPVQTILRHTADGGQKLLFSATLDTGVAALVNEFLIDPAVHEVAGEDQASGTIEHRVLVIDHREKLEVIRELVDRGGKTLVFTRTRSYAEDVANGLEDEGIAAVALHGDLNQAKRTRNLEKLTKGRVNVLVATDVAARGIHVDDIDLVIQADAPDEYKTYLHRSGRTGRAGKTGTVVMLTSRGRTRRIEGLLERAEITAEWSEVRPGDVLLADLANGTAE
ncbi:DEAD/DEAH box helicase [Gryllotalpicola protaetiae]|uniref:DEAD/DEAH box helicase n=1 Tax=Gryllotalpicola protaetiae TaxID=2419771 RepID=A0A387BLH2_9MICO|nr:DEAD/DEAH box helicase [Gryllotalpicola protaetiae]AYG03212.1 DEAD/DEAH box helicase [Gryllotalpicola protaetiae]